MRGVISTENDAQYLSSSPPPAVLVFVPKREPRATDRANHFSDPFHGLLNFWLVNYEVLHYEMVHRYTDYTAVVAEGERER